MKPNANAKHQRCSTRFSDDGCTVFVRLRVDRRDYEYAKSWAEWHAPADPGGTAEDQLEGYLNMALTRSILYHNWFAPPKIKALYPKVQNDKSPDGDMDDGIPF